MIGLASLSGEEQELTSASLGSLVFSLSRKK